MHEFEPSPQDFDLTHSISTSFGFASLWPAASFATGRAYGAMRRWVAGLRTSYNRFMLEHPISRRWQSFWVLQGIGWALFLGLTLLSYGPLLQTRLDRLSECASLAFAFLCSFVLYGLCGWLWRRGTSLGISVLLSFLTSYLLASAGSWVLGWVRFPYTHEPVTFAAVSSGSYCNVIALVTWSAFYFGIRHYQASEARQLRLQASELSARDAQLQALQYQLQPHFLFNTLNAISSLVISDQKPAATEMISRLGDLLRNALETPETPFTSLAQELALTDEYLSIERVRFGARLKVTIDVDQDAQTSLVPRWLLQPLIENAIRHGVSRLPHGGEVVVRARIDDAWLLLTIVNDLGHQDDASKSLRQGVGLANTRARLVRLYGDLSSLTAAPHGGDRYVVSIRLPFRSAGDEDVSSVEAQR